MFESIKRFVQAIKNLIKRIEDKINGFFNTKVQVETPEKVLMYKTISQVIVHNCDIYKNVRRREAIRQRTRKFRIRKKLDKRIRKEHKTLFAIRQVKA